MQNGDEPFVTDDRWGEALEVTAAGVGTTFVILIVLMLLILVMKWVFATTYVQRKTGALAAAEAVAAQRDRALAAAIAVSTALTEDESIDRRDAPADTPI